MCVRKRGPVAIQGTNKEGKKIVDRLGVVRSLVCKPG